MRIGHEYAVAAAGIPSSGRALVFLAGRGSSVIVRVA